jgi:hypothetical protein
MISLSPASAGVGATAPDAAAQSVSSNAKTDLRWRLRIVNINDRRESMIVTVRRRNR